MITVDFVCELRCSDQLHTGTCHLKSLKSNVYNVRMNINASLIRCECVSVSLHTRLTLFICLFTHCLCFSSVRSLCFLSPQHNLIHSHVSLSLLYVFLSFTFFLGRSFAPKCDFRAEVKCPRETHKPFKEREANGERLLYSRDGC